MNVIETTSIFDNWLDNLKDLKAKVLFAQLKLQNIGEKND